MKKTQFKVKDSVRLNLSYSDREITGMITSSLLKNNGQVMHEVVLDQEFMGNNHIWLYEDELASIDFPLKRRA